MKNKTKFSLRDYSYEALSSKPDMEITTVRDVASGDRKAVIAEGNNTAIAVGKANSDGSVSVYVEDAEIDVVVSNNGLQHGLRRVKNEHRETNENANFLVAEKVGEILRDSIQINELTPEEKNDRRSIVLIGTAQSQSGK